MSGTDRNERLAQIEVRVEDISLQLRTLDQKFDGFNQRMDRRFDDLRTEMAKQFRWTLGVMLTLAGLIVALVRH